MKKLILTIVTLFPVYLFAQDLTVNGKVLEKEGKTPMPGVSVFVKGTTNGVISDDKGGFSIKANLSDTLTFSFLSMKTVEFVVTNSETITIYMEVSATDLGEVEVVSYGYYEINKRDVTGSIGQVTSKELEKSRTNSVEQMLQGQIAGVVVNESGEPGSGVGISIRGTNSMLGGTQPLYVVDGIPIDPLSDAEGNSGAGQQQNGLSFLNPNDIDRIEVLKDAAATALFGARGANGVVIITTKTANEKDGTDRFSVNVDMEAANVIRQLDVLDGLGFERYMNQRHLNQLYQDITDPNRNGVVFDGSQELNSTNFPELNTLNIPYPETTGINTRWQDQVYRRAFTKRYNVAYRTGTKNRNLSMSLGFVNNEGVIVNSNFNRLTYNMNARRNAFDGKLKVLSKTNISYKTGNSVSVGNGEIFQQRGVVSQALQFQPIFDLLELGQDDDVYAELNEGNIVSNPYTLANFVIDEKEAFTFNQSIGITYKFTKNWSASVKGAGIFQRSNRDNYYPTNTTRGRRNNGEASQAFLQNMKTYGEANIKYQKNFKDKHRINAIALGTIEQNNIRSMFNKAFGFGSDVTSFYNFTSATDILVPVAQFRQVGLLSGLARVGYNYKWKYYVNVNARIDASSKFAANNKSAFFPSIALAWVPTREDFLKDHDYISFLKIRTSYGKTGSNPIAPYQSLALMTPIRYNFDNELVTGYYEANLANDDLTWETTDQYNVGVDMRLFDDLMSVTVDAYYKKTKDLLQNVNLPASNGYATRVDNFGEVENKGIEMTLKGKIISGRDFHWEVLGNIGFNRNKLLSLNSNLTFQLGPSVGFSQANPSMFMEGMPLGIFWGAQTNGIYANWEEAIGSGIEGAAPGEIIYVNNHIDVDADGNPLDIQQINFDDYVQIGDPNPDFTAAITNNFSYKNWDLSILITGQKGGDIFWVDSWQIYGNSRTVNVLTNSFETAWIAPLEYQNGQVVYNPSAGNTENVENPAPIVDISNRSNVSDRQIFDGSFIKVKNINLGYNFKLKNKRSVRLYVAGRNVFIWSRYPGYDPEVQTYYKNPQKRGIDFGSYPGTKMFMLGAKFNY